jgi:hypothetical protein
MAYSKKPTSRNGSIERVKGLFEEFGVNHSATASGREITFNSPAGKIKINHNGNFHWTMRIPGCAKDGVRFNFSVPMAVDNVNKLIIFNEVMAIRYD